MSVRGPAWFGLVLLTILAGAPKPAHAGSYENAVLAELNRVRADPAAYARELRRQFTRARYVEEPGYGVQEDPEAVEDAIVYLMRQEPLPPLAADQRLNRAARAHVASQGPTRATGHGPSGSFGRRLQAQGMFAGVSAESISYGQDTARDVIRQLIIDSGVPNRGHRKDLLSRAFRVAGVSCGPHAAWGSMCVIDLAGAVVQR